MPVFAARELAGAFLAAALMLALPALACAQHPTVEEGRRLFEEAEFEAAMAALSRAEQADGLTRADLVELLRVRVLLRVAMEQPDGLEADVERLLSLDPSFDFGGTAPPEVAQSVAQMRRRIREPIGIETSAEPTADGVSVHARVVNDPAGLARDVRITARAGGGAWFGPLESPLEMPVPEGQSLHYHAEVIGPGGVVLAHAGTEQEPLSWSAGQITAGGGAPAGDDSAIWIGLGITAAVVVVAIAIIVTAVLVSDSQSGTSDQTRPRLPVIASF